MNWYEIADIEQVDSPALIAYPDRIQHNIDLLISMIDDVKRIRTHVKSHKCLPVVEMQLRSGISKFKCATIAEAEMLGMAKAPDVLLAYQPAGPKLDRFISLIKAYPETKYSCLFDNLETARIISTAALANNIQIAVYLDLNVGMNRTGINPGSTAIELYLQCNQFKGLKVSGLHAYDGHVHEPQLETRTLKADSIYNEVAQMQTQLIAAGSAKPVVIIGGTPTYPVYAQKPEVECSPGTFIYWDAGYQESFQEQPFQTAVLVITRVISLPNATKICIDLGHKSIASESSLDKRVRFLNAPELSILSHSEEHMVLEAGKYHPFKPDDILYALAYHICPTIALYDSLYIVKDKHVTDNWPIMSRTRKITI